jgi:predicted lysophospholipase L1 biosynthesis ABC-type transport system permease subunit
MQIIGLIVVILVAIAIRPLRNLVALPFVLIFRVVYGVARLLFAMIAVVVIIVAFFLLFLNSGVVDPRILNHMGV